MDGTENTGAGKVAVVKRLIALLALGSAIALAVVQVTNMLKHDVSVRLIFSEQLLENVRRVEIVALKSGQSHPSSSVEMIFDDSHPARLPVEHRFELTNGKYDLHFRIFGFDKSTFVRVSRSLDVTGSMSVSYQLP